MEKQIDSYRFISGITKRMIKNWISMETPRPIPWTPMTKPVNASRVALLSSAGMAMKDDRPFDQEGERRNPWWGDPSYRILPSDATERDIRLYHLHIDPSFAMRDLNCLLPLQRLAELAGCGEVGSIAPRHYSMMGYILQPEILLRETAPAIINDLREDQVDVLLLAPA